MRLSDLRIKTSMILVFALTLAMVAIIIGVMQYGIVESTNGYGKLIDDQGKMAEEIHNSQSQINIIAQLLRHMTLFGYDEAATAYIVLCNEQIDNAIAVISRVYDQPDELDVQYAQGIEVWRESVQQVQKALSENDLDRAKDLLEDAESPTLSPIMMIGDELMRFAIEEKDTQRAELESEFVRNRTIMWGIVGLLIIVITVSQLNLIKRIVNPFKEIETAVVGFSKGDLTCNLEHQSNSEIGKVCDGVRSSQHTVSEIMGDIENVTHSLESGDLTVKIAREYPGQFSPIKKNLHNLTASLNRTMGSIMLMTDQVSGGADQVSDVSQELANGAAQQAGAIQELSAAIADMDNGAQDNANNAGAAKERSAQVVNQIQVSHGRIQEMYEAMNDISTGQQDIDKIILTIENIAFQTNILALNAAVEAARAGASGKGFAVVADEVRNLASRADQAAKHTKKLIENSLSYVNRGTHLVEDVVENMEKTMQSMDQAIESIDKLADTTVSQAGTISQLTNGVEQIASVVQMNSATSEQLAAASKELSTHADQMRKMLHGMKLEDGVASTTIHGDVVFGHEPPTSLPALEQRGYSSQYEQIDYEQMNDDKY